MRDVKRIEPFLKQFGELWRENPDLRFGQLVHIIAHNIGGDMFVHEEEKWLEQINKMV